VKDEVKALLERGAIQPVPNGEAHCVCPVHVVANGEKLRVTVDTRYPNSEVCNPHFQLETLGQFAGAVLEPGMQMVTSDITKAYYSVPLHEDAGKYFCFEVDGQVYQPLTMVTGSAQAPYYFNKLQRVVTRFARAVGVGVNNYFDDHLWYDVPERMPAVVEFARWLLPELGFVFNRKGTWKPSPLAKFLGYRIDLLRMLFTVEEDKLRRIMALVVELRSQIQNQEAVSVLLMQRVCGCLMSVQLAVPHVRVWTRSLYYEIAKAGRAKEAWPGMHALVEVDYWERNLLQCNGKAIRQPRVTYPLEVDASGEGWGACTDLSSVFGQFDAVAAQGSSTARELEGLLRAGQTLQKELQGKSVLVLMDSSAAVRNLIKEGGPVPHLSAQIKRWVQFCQTNSITCGYEWRRRELNTRADALSKMFSNAPTLREDAIRRILDSAGADAVWCQTGAELLAARGAQAGVCVVHVDYNTIQNQVEVCERNRSRILLVHPVFPDKLWWPAVRRTARQTWQLPTLDRMVAEQSKPGRGWQAWPMQLSDIDCRAQPAAGR
jgi:hypothetical protein